MIHVSLPQDKMRPLSFYLAMEEYLADRDENDYFFIWQVNPTVIIGRNQNLLAEVNVDYCRDHNIDIVRRRSGGGCVYADRNNLMLSYITNSQHVSTTFDHYTAMIADMLNSLDIAATAGGRNDIYIEGRKVSGNAFYHKNHRAIVHGTMLYNTNIEAMLQAITPSGTKLTAQGVKSVRSHVINLTEVTDMSLDCLKNKAVKLLCDSTLELTEADVENINKIAHNYISPYWLSQHARHSSTTFTKRVDGAGTFDVTIRLQGDKIKSINLQGDYFPLADVDATLLSRLNGVAYTRSNMQEAIKDIKVDNVIARLNNENFINLIYNG